MIPLRRSSLRLLPAFCERPCILPYYPPFVSPLPCSLPAGVPPTPSPHALPQLRARSPHLFTCFTPHPPFTCLFPTPPPLQMSHPHCAHLAILRSSIQRPHSPVTAPPQCSLVLESHQSHCCAALLNLSPQQLSFFRPCPATCFAVASPMSTNPPTNQSANLYCLCIACVWLGSAQR